MTLYSDEEYRKFIGFGVAVVLVVLVFGLWIWFSTSVLPRAEHVNGYFLFGVAHATTVNGTANMPIPIQVHVNDPNDKPAASSSALPVDGATVATVAGLGAALVHNYRRSDKRDKAGAETDAKIVGSLKNTDHGIADSLDVIHKAIAAIPGVPPEVTNMVKSEAEAWKSDNKAYYQSTPTPTAAKITSDPVVQQQAATQDQTVRSDD